MFTFLILWLWRGGDRMSIQPTDTPPPVHVRTIHDVEADLLNARHAQRRGPARRYPDEVTRFDKAVNDYLDEWAWHHAGGPALDFPVDDRADEAPMVTLAGGPLDAPLD